MSGVQFVYCGSNIPNAANILSIALFYIFLLFKRVLFFKIFIVNESYYNLPWGWSMFPKVRICFGVTTCFREVPAKAESLEPLYCFDFAHYPTHRRRI